MSLEHKIPELLFITEGKAIEEILRRAVRHALLIHKQAGNPVAVWKDEQVVLIPAEKISVGENIDYNTN